MRWRWSESIYGVGYSGGQKFKFDILGVCFFNKRTHLEDLRQLLHEEFLDIYREIIDEKVLYNQRAVTRGEEIARVDDAEFADIGVTRRLLVLDSGEPYVEVDFGY